MSNLKNIISIIIFVFIAINSFAINNIYIDTVFVFNKKIDKSILFNDYTTVYKSEVNHNINDLLEKIKSEEIRKTTNNAARGFTKDYYWIFFKFKNATHKNLEFILDNFTPNIDSVFLMAINHNTIDTIFVSGKKIAFNKRSIKSNQIYFPFKLKAKSESLLYVLKIAKIGDSLAFPLGLENKSYYFNSIKNKRLFHFIYFSVLFVIIFISLSYGLITKQNILVAYGTYALSLGLYFFSYKAYTIEYLDPNNNFILKYNSLFQVFIYIAFLFFIIVFLELKIHNKKLYNLYRNLIFLGFFVSILFLINNSLLEVYVFKFFYYLSILTLFSVPITLSKIYKKNKLAVITLIIVLVPIIFGTLTTMLVGLGFFPGSLLKYDLMLTGSFIEMGFIAFAIIYKIYIRDNNRRKLLLKELEVQKELLEAYKTGSENKNSKISNELNTKVSEQLEYIEQLIKKKANKEIITKHINDVYENIRQLSHKLSHQTLKIIGLENSLKQLVTKKRQGTDITIFINFIDFKDLFDKKGLYIYNVIEEALENAITHSQCSEVLIEIIGHNDETIFTIDDDGIGFEIDKLKSKINILNMQTRINLIGGFFEISSYPNKGTHIFFSVPVS